MSSPHELTPPKERSSIELARGMAAVLVMLCHYAPFLGTGQSFARLGFVGVYWFFAISGFLFAPLILGIRPVDLRGFLVRRAVRILPLYWIAVAVYAAISPWQADSLVALAINATFLHTWLGFNYVIWFNIAFWSLPAEVQFYLLIPLLARWRWRSPLVRVLALACGALILKLAIAPHLEPFPPTDNRISLALWLDLPGQLIMFLIGTGTWIAFGRIEKALTFARSCGFLMIGIALIAGSLFAYVQHGQERWLNTEPVAFPLFEVAVACGFSLMIIAVAGLLDVRTPPRPLARIAAFLGQISFGVYLLHNAAPPILEKLVGRGLATNAPACIVFTALTAWILHRAVEAPARDWARRKSSQLETTQVEAKTTVG